MTDPDAHGDAVPSASGALSALSRISDTVAADPTYSIAGATALISGATIAPIEFLTYRKLDAILSIEEASLPPIALLYPALLHAHPGGRRAALPDGSRPPQLRGGA